ncbi:MAG: PIG-L family deacetylase, partial [Gemmatimonadetes bacterium]|nr:PIG-L family deacetylase [Gemmatimonadota bacterium]
MRRNNLLLIALLAHVFAAAAPAAAQLQETEYQGAAALGLALRRLGTTRRVLMIAAHPDDENTALLSELALGEGADVAYLSLTRGEGGQNLIGPELGEQLGLIRSEELLAARRLDGARQFFTRAYEFGYSKSAEETFRHWPRDSLLSDVVAVIRSFRPDILVTIFTGTPRDGHGQHQVAGILAREAFLAARDPLRFPEQLARGLRPHTVQKLFQSSWRQTNEPATVIPTGELDPLLGRSHFQIAMASRSRHRSQDMGQAQLPGPRASRVQLVARASDPPQAVAPGAVAAGAPEPSMFTGVATTLAAKVQAHMAVSPYPLRPALATLTEYETHIERVRAEYNALAPSALVPGLAAAVGLLQRADSQLVAVGPGPGMDDLRFLLNRELEDARTALARAAGLVLDAIADDERVVAGQSFGLELTLWNGGDRRVTVRSLEPVLPASWQAVARDSLSRAPLAPGQLLTRKFSVQVPASAAPTEPYFLRRPRAGFVYDWPADPDTANLAFGPPEVRARARVEVAGAEVALGV